MFQCMINKYEVLGDLHYMAIKVHYISILLANMDIIKFYERNQWKGAKDKLVIKLLTMDF